MKRPCSALATLALVASLAGCAMCQSPFDYCSPVAGPRWLSELQLQRAAGIRLRTHGRQR